VRSPCSNGAWKSQKASYSLRKICPAGIEENAGILRSKNSASAFSRSRPKYSDALASKQISSASSPARRKSPPSRSHATGSQLISSLRYPKPGHAELLESNSTSANKIVLIDVIRTQEWVRKRTATFDEFHASLRRRCVRIKLERSAKGRSIKL
jgi:hypothetical protein